MLGLELLLSYFLSIQHLIVRFCLLVDFHVEKIFGFVFKEWVSFLLQQLVVHNGCYFSSQLVRVSEPALKLTLDFSPHFTLCLLSVLDNFLKNVNSTNWAQYLKKVIFIFWQIKDQDRLYV